MNRRGAEVAEARLNFAARPREAERNLFVFGLASGAAFELRARLRALCASSCCSAAAFLAVSHRSEPTGRACLLQLSIACLTVAVLAEAAAQAVSDGL